MSEFNTGVKENMSLISCPECKNAISTNALSCPNCGYAFVVEDPIVVNRVVATERKDTLPKWLIITGMSLLYF